MSDFEIDGESNSDFEVSWAEDQPNTSFSKYENKKKSRSPDKSKPRKGSSSPQLAAKPQTVPKKSIVGGLFGSKVDASNDGYDFDVDTDFSKTKGSYGKRGGASARGSPERASYSGTTKGMKGQYSDASGLSKSVNALPKNADAMTRAADMLAKYASVGKGQSGGGGAPRHKARLPESYEDDLSLGQSDDDDDDSKFKMSEENARSATVSFKTKGNYNASATAKGSPNDDFSVDISVSSSSSSSSSDLGRQKSAKSAYGTSTNRPSSARVPIASGAAKVAANPPALRQPEDSEESDGDFRQRLPSQRASSKPAAPSGPPPNANQVKPLVSVPASGVTALGANKTFANTDVARTRIGSDLHAFGNMKAVVFDDMDPGIRSDSGASSSSSSSSGGADARHAGLIRSLESSVATSPAAALKRVSSASRHGRSDMITRADENMQQSSEDENEESHTLSRVQGQSRRTNMASDSSSHSDDNANDVSDYRAVDLSKDSEDEASGYVSGGASDDGDDPPSPNRNVLNFADLGSIAAWDEPSKEPVPAPAVAPASKFNAASTLVSEESVTAQKEQFLQPVYSSQEPALPSQERRDAAPQVSASVGPMGPPVLPPAPGYASVQPPWSVHPQYFYPPPYVPGSAGSSMQSNYPFPYWAVPPMAAPVAVTASERAEGLLANALRDGLRASTDMIGRASVQSAASRAQGLLQSQQGLRASAQSNPSVPGLQAPLHTQLYGQGQPSVQVSVPPESVQAVVLDLLLELREARIEAASTRQKLQEILDRDAAPVLVRNRKDRSPSPRRHMGSAPQPTSGTAISPYPLGSESEYADDFDDNEQDYSNDFESATSAASETSDLDVSLSVSNVSASGGRVGLNRSRDSVRSRSPAATTSKVMFASSASRIATAGPHIPSTVVEQPDVRAALSSRSSAPAPVATVPLGDLATTNMLLQQLLAAQLAQQVERPIVAAGSEIRTGSSSQSLQESQQKWQQELQHQQWLSMQTGRLPPSAMQDLQSSLNGHHLLYQKQLEALRMRARNVSGASDSHIAAFASALGNENVLNGIDLTSPPVRVAGANDVPSGSAAVGTGSSSFGGTPSLAALKQQFEKRRQSDFAALRELINAVDPGLAMSL